MLEITIHVTGLEKLADALLSLSGVKASAADSTVNAGTGVPSSVPQPGAVPTAAVPQQMPVTPAPAAAVGQPMPGAVPTTVVPQEYTQDQIAVAMTGLSDQGRGPELVNILARFGVASLVQVPRERYPELVLLLREAGAAI